MTGIFGNHVTPRWHSCVTYSTGQSRPASQGGSPINTNTLSINILDENKVVAAVLRDGTEVRGVVIEVSADWFTIGVGDMMPRRIYWATVVEYFG